MQYKETLRAGAVVSDAGPYLIGTVDQNSLFPSRGPGKDGQMDECLAYLEEVRTDMCPAGLGTPMALSEVTK